LPISPLRVNPFRVFLLISVSSLPGDPQALDCDSCMHSPCSGSAVTKTLVFHTYYSCAGTIVGSCTPNHTTYSVCFHVGHYISFNPIYCPWEQWLEVQSFTNTEKLVNHTQVNDPNKPMSIYFELCATIAKNTGPWGNCWGASLGKDLQVK
jgi:hypothetical protein